MSGGAKFEGNSAGLHGGAVHPPQPLSTRIAPRILHSEFKTADLWVPPLKYAASVEPQVWQRVHWCGWEGPYLPAKRQPTQTVASPIFMFVASTDAGAGCDISHGPWISPTS